jgi:FMN phosphatase YigB (HAD superfamily)
MKLFVWDFHGVLENNNERAVLEITNRVLFENNFNYRLSSEQCQEFYGLKWFEYFMKLDNKLTLQRCLDLQEKCFQLSSNNPEIVAKHIKRTPGAKKVLSEIHSHHKQILISNTDPVAIKMFIKSIKIDQFFTNENTYPVNSHRDITKNKKGILSEFLSNHGSEFEELVTIGDSPGDIELSSLFPKSKSYLYSHPGRPYKDCQSDFKINNLLELLKEI